MKKNDSKRLHEGKWKIEALFFPMAIKNDFNWGEEKLKCNRNIDRKPQITPLICKGIPWDFSQKQMMCPTPFHGTSESPGNYFQTKEKEKAINYVGK